MIGKLKMLHKMAKWQLNFLPCPAHFLTAKFQPIMGEDIAELAIQMIKQDLKGEHAYGTGPEIYSLEDWIDIVGKGRIKLIRIPKWLIDKPFRLITIFLGNYLIIRKIHQKGLFLRIHPHNLLTNLQ